MVLSGRLPESPAAKGNVDEFQNQNGVVISVVGFESIQASYFVVSKLVQPPMGDRQRHG